jgi:hypothetical protein
MPKFLCLYKHCGKEVHIDPRGNYVFQPMFIEKTMLAGSKWSVDDHKLSVYRSGLLKLCDSHPRDKGFLGHRFPNQSIKEEQ